MELQSARPNQHRERQQIEGGIHRAGRPIHPRVQTTPLAKDGILYYSGSYSKVFAVKGDTGEILWSYIPKLDEDTIARQTHSPYNRGMAMGNGNLYIGTVDGRLIAIDMKTGKPVWDTKLINSQKLTVGFTGAPLLVKDKIIIGAQGGEWPDRGPIFGVDAKSGNKVWEFLTVAGTPEAEKTWANESWRTGRRRLDAGHLRRRDQFGVVGHRQSGSALLEWVGLEDKRSTSGVIICTRLRSSRSIRTRQAQILSSGTAARCLGL